MPTTFLCSNIINGGPVLVCCNVTSSAVNTNMQNKGIIEYFGLGEGHRCGYCGQTDTNISHGMWAHQLSCQNYEDLINRGWRRSGKYVYQPLMNKLCCPMYTIRCDVTDFKMSKSQKKVLKKMRKYLIDGKEPNSSTEAELETAKTTAETTKDKKDKKEIKSNPKTEQTNSEERSKSHKLVADGNIKPCKKAKEIRRENKLKKIAERKAKGEIVEPSNEQSCCSKTVTNSEQNIEDLIEIPEGVALSHKLEVKTVKSCPKSKEFSDTFPTAYNLFKKYQMKIHDETEDENDIQQFKRFLVDCPLLAEESRQDTPNTGLGAFHQQYYIDGKLVAVGVIDILPHCMSSKYFFYDPNYSFLSLGTYSALREIYFIRKLQRDCPEFKYYYMGYYIHSCQKMRYKGQYEPSFLLCPEAYTFQPIKNCIQKLDASRYARFDPNETTDEDVKMEDILVLCDGTAMPSFVYLQMFVQDADKEAEIKELKEYAKLAGKASKDIFIYRAVK